MKKISLMVFFPAVLVACAPVPGADLNNPNKRTVNVDDHQISVAPEGSNVYVAWGGEDDKDGFVQYRQRRAIELISGCRVTTVLSKKTDDVLRAKVKC